MLSQSMDMMTWNMDVGEEGMEGEVVGDLCTCYLNLVHGNSRVASSFACFL